MGINERNNGKGQPQAEDPSAPIIVGMTESQVEKLFTDAERQGRIEAAKEALDARRNASRPKQRP